MANLALGSWKAIIIKLFRVLNDLEGQRRSRFDTAVAPFKKSDRVDREELAWNDSLALELWMMLIAQIAFRTVEGVLSSYVYPHCLATLTTPTKNGDVVRANMIARIRASIAAFMKYKDNTHTVIRRMIGRCFWRSGLGILIRTILVVGGEAELAVLLDYLKLLFEGVGTTKICEDANRFVKEIVMRQRASTQQRMVVLWAQAVMKKLASMSYHRNEMPIHTTLPCSSKFDDGFFEHCQASVDTEGGETDLDLVSITKKADHSLLGGSDWVVLAAEDQILQVWARMNRAAPEELWQVDLVPEWVVLKDATRTDNRFFFVLKVIPHRALLGFNVDVDIFGFWIMPKTPLEYRPWIKLIHNIHNFYVLPQKPLSPKGVRWHARKMVERLTMARRGFQAKIAHGYRGPLQYVPPEQLDSVGTRLLWTDEPALSLVDHQVQNGFKGVTVNTMESLIKVLGVEATEMAHAETDAYETEEAKALGIMLHRNKSMGLLQAQLALQNRREQRRGDASGLQSLLKTDVLRDLLLQEDLTLVQNLVEDAEYDDEIYEEASRAARKHVHSVWKKMHPEEYENANREYVAAIAPPMWVPLATGDSDIVILEKLRAPWPVKTIKDTKNGHYTVTYLGAHWKAASWTWIRVPKAALQLILTASWKCAIKKFGRHPSPEIEAAIASIPDLDIPGLNRQDED